MGAYLREEKSRMEYSVLKHAGRGKSNGGGIVVYV